MSAENSLQTAFPFNHLDDSSFNLVLYELAHGTMNYTNDLFETLLFNPIVESPISSSFPSNLDPDNNLSFNLPVSEYAVEEAFADKTASLNINLTLMHLNARSLLGNFDNFKYLLTNLRKSLSVMGVSETWLNDLTCDQVNISEYNFVSNHRSSKVGGGIGLYLQSNLKYKVLEKCNLSDPKAIESLHVCRNRSGKQEKYYHRYCLPTPKSKHRAIFGQIQ